MVFDLRYIVQHYNLDIKGVLHVGGYSGEESRIYRELGIVRCTFFEPQSLMYPICKRNASGYMVEKLALGDIEGEIELNISYTEGGVLNGSGASSSILKPTRHLIEHPHISFTKTEKVKIVRLDDYLDRKNLNGKYNFISLDVQGYELNVLKGARELLHNIDGAIIEVNTAPMYEGCPLVDEIDEFLEPYGLKRVLTFMQHKSLWGDAYYHKERTNE